MTSTNPSLPVCEMSGVGYVLSSALSGLQDYIILTVTHTW